jgi:phospholipid/cholesterol/gamma-HCH transport system ATP-binding protein
VVIAEPSGADPVVALRGLHKRFGQNHVLRGVDLDVPRGGITTILGGSGTGKSVMLKHMIGLLRADSGSVLVEGRDVSQLSERDWVEVRRSFGYVFQGAALFDSLSVYENVAYPLREHRRWSRERMDERVAQCLASVGLEGVESQMPAELSGGMRKRVGVARAIALEPKVILYDEPTTGLDPANSRRIGELILSLRARLEVTSAIVTHDLALCFSISDQVVLLEAGQIVASGSPDEMLASSHPSVKDFIAGSVVARSRPAGISQNESGEVVRGG